MPYLYSLTVDVVNEKEAVGLIMSSAYRRRITALCLKTQLHAEEHSFTPFLSSQGYNLDGRLVSTLSQEDDCTWIGDCQASGQEPLPVRDITWMSDQSSPGHRMVKRQNVALT